MPRIEIDEKWIRNLSKQDQITELNNEVRCKLGASKIEGVGVFTIRNIRKGDRLYLTPNLIPRFYNISYGSLSGLLPEIKELVLARWASVVNGSFFQSPNDDAGLLFFVNHSPEPNYDHFNDIALRDIKTGEEVVEDYCAMTNAEKVYKWLKCDKNAIYKPEEKSNS